ncbi:peroxiredoxin [Marinoscillum sp. MHG1-6]|uniref:peroxiredoxin family protein n=1 Tax=Marinoscillum sp. MHG1-6 TaxID=2959627 RepID=UPI0021585770|nr:TlpA disulfide reductase family protein [Marinoscillum sp. MHG1-6]
MNRLVKNTIYLIASLFVLASCQAKNEGISVSGMITNPINEGAVVVSEFQSKGLVAIDTFEVKDDGSFIGYLKVTQPGFYKLDMQGRRIVNLILNGSEEDVNIELDLEDEESPVIEGAPESEHVLVFDQMIKNMKDDQQMLNQQAMQAKMNENQAEFESITDEYMTLLDDFNDKVKKYARQAAPSVAVFYGISVLKPEDHMSFFKEMRDIYVTELPDHFFTEDLKTRVDYMSKLAIGEDAPEISLPSPDGEIITLSSLKGNYVLIDFWAGWCRPCRMENPNVVRLYKMYQDKNFEILGVSLDRTRDQWVKAIEQDGLIWKHVSDLSYFNSEAAQAYQINSIPATYLIDPDGKIIAKGLRGPSLEAKLKEIFG